MRLGFDVLDLIELMRAQMPERDERASYSVNITPIELDTARVEVEFPGGNVSLYLRHADLDMSASAFFEQWIQPAMRPCLCGASQIDGVLPCGH